MFLLPIFNPLLKNSLNTVCNEIGGENRIDIETISDNKHSEEATKSSQWNCRGSTEFVSHLSASTQCLFCSQFTQMYFPNKKFMASNSGHLMPLFDLNSEFYSHSQNNDFDRCPNINNYSVSPESLKDYKNSNFDYCFDRNNLKSHQQYINDPNLFDRAFLIREGIPEQILKYCNPPLTRIKFNISTVAFVFKNTNSIRYRLYKKLKTTQHLRDILYRQFSTFIKDFIAICIKQNSITFLDTCLENNFIPKKFRKRIDIESKHRTRNIRKDCVAISKHLIEQTITEAKKELDNLNTKFHGFLWSKCCSMDPLYKTLIYDFLIKIRNVCAFVCSVKHNHKIAVLTQKTPHICIKIDNVIDVALKTTEAKVEECDVLHFPHLYWSYRQYTIESFRYQLEPLGEGNNDDDTLSSQTMVWETYLSKVTKSKSLIPKKKNVINDFKNDWNKFLYGFRWSQSPVFNSLGPPCDLNLIDQSKYIPWQKPSVNLPARSNPEAEIFLASLKLTINKQLTESWEAFEYDTQDNVCTQEILQTFLDSHNYRVVSSDKTNRCLLINNETYIRLGEKFLSDSRDYLLLSRDPSSVILDKANSIITAIKKTNHTFRRGDLDKLTKYDAAPANLSFLIKDHKDKDNDGNFPLRPLANINNSSLDGLDWLLSKIVNQGIKLAKYHIWNAQQLLQTIPKINLTPVKNTHTRRIISLDVVGLYPSIPVLDACNMVFRFLKDNPQINTFGIPYPILKELMTTIANNYIIAFNGKVYKQTKGVAMGARFSCAFSIIFMHIIEHNLVEQWFSGEVLQGSDLLYYGRYIDDVVIIFDQVKENTDFSHILQAFNSLHRNIKFTIESNIDTGFLSFLDMELYMNEDKVATRWYTKPQHSGNFIKGTEYLPENVKRNTLIERFRAVMIRSTEIKYARQGVHKVVEILLNNQHSLFKIMGAIRQAFVKNDNKLTTPYHSANNELLYDYDWREDKQLNYENSIAEFEKPKPVLKIPYLGEQLKRSISEVINRFGRDQQVRVVYTSNKRLKFLTPMQSDNNRHNVDQRDFCIICQNIEGGDNFHCASRVVVYQFECKLCHQIYIGKTNKTVKERVNAHFSLFKKGSNNSPLWAHESIYHAGTTPTTLVELFERYSFKIIEQNKDYVLNNVAEAEAISRLKPLINRREEVPEWDIDAEAIDFAI